MNLGQIIYIVALAGVLAWRGWTFPAWVLVCNCLATLCACAAMDAGTLGREDATLAMMLIDFLSGAALLTGSGAAYIVAAGYAVTVPLYSLSIIFSVSEVTTYALVMAVGFAQLAVAGIGPGGNDRGGMRGRAHVAAAVSFPGGSSGDCEGVLAARRGLLSQGSGRLN